MNGQIPLQFISPASAAMNALAHINWSQHKSLVQSKLQQIQHSLSLSICTSICMQQGVHTSLCSSMQVLPYEQAAASHMSMLLRRPSHAIVSRHALKTGFKLGHPAMSEHSSSTIWGAARLGPHQNIELVEITMNKAPGGQVPQHVHQLYVHRSRVCQLHLNSHNHFQPHNRKEYQVSPTKQRNVMPG